MKNKVLAFDFGASSGRAILAVYDQGKLTVEAGKETIADIVNIYDEWLENVESCLSEEEKEQFHTYCMRLLEKAKTM